MDIAKLHRNPAMAWAAILVALLIPLILAVNFAYGSSPRQDDSIHAEASEIVRQCQECHLDIANHWGSSPHAHAFDDPVFQQRWTGMGKPSDCLSCHTTNFEPATGEFAAEGVDCRACHGEVGGEHPPAPVAILADEQYCGKCHTTTLGEWHRTGHATSGVGCMQCHDPHSQGPLFADADEMCLNCHKESMGPYLEDLHVSKGIGCVDCHALVIPPDPIPDDGIVPTGHSFSITPATCVACHTDALHAGFSLPGYENGAKALQVDEVGEVTTVGFQPPVRVVEAAGSTNNLSAEQRIQTLEAALASRNVSAQFQGALVGLVFGGMTAWFVASNLRTRSRDESHDEEG
jgi:predicted CXXCH cytochrome family protein